MTPVDSIEALTAAIEASDAVLVLFGGPTCSVCTAIQPRLEALLAERFDRLVQLYVDCDAHPELAAQAGIHTRPVVRAYFAGQLHIEHVRVFGLEQVAGELARPYGLMFDA